MFPSLPKTSDWSVNEKSQSEHINEPSSSKLIVFDKNRIFKNRLWELSPISHKAQIDYFVEELHLKDSLFSQEKGLYFEAQTKARTIHGVMKSSGGNFIFKTEYLFFLRIIKNYLKSLPNTI